MQKEVFLDQIEQLYKEDSSHIAAIRREMQKATFQNISEKLMDNERVELVAPIANDPILLRKTKTSFLRDWYILLTDKRVIFASPTLILKEMTFLSYPYSDVASVESGKWNSMKIRLKSTFVVLSIVGSYFYYEQRDEMVRIIEQHIYS